MWFMLNKKANIQILTGCGLTDFKEKHELIGQGTLGGAIVSACNLDSDVNDYFRTSDEACYGSVRLQPLLFQDDVIHLTTSRERAQAGVMRMEAVMKSKQLEVHPDKTCHLVLGTSHTRDRTSSEIKLNPLIYDTFEVKEKPEAKYLGDFLHHEGNNSSTLATIMSRRGRVKKCIFEIGPILDDIRLQSIGGLLCGITIWNTAIIPHLLNNSEVWSDLEKDSMDELEKLQTLFLSVLLAVPLSCARPALAWDTASLSMKNRVIQRKLNFMVHLKKLKEKDLANQIFREQRSNGYPGLVKESRELCEQIGLPDITK